MHRSVSTIRIMIHAEAVSRTVNQCNAVHVVDMSGEL